MDPIKNKNFVLKGRVILTLSRGGENAYQISRRTGFSYPTVHRIIERPKSVQSIKLNILATLLSAGLGLNDQEILDMRLGDLFEIHDAKDTTTGQG